MNHEIIAWLRGDGHEVTVFLPHPRLRDFVQHCDVARVTGIGIRSWGQFVFVSDVRAGLAVLGRNLLAALPLRFGTALRKRVGAHGRADAVLGAFITTEHCVWCAGKILQMAPDAVFADTIFRSDLLREPALAAIRHVLVAHDLFYLRHLALRSAGYVVSPAELSREREARLLSAADVIVAIQPQEAESIREMCPDKTVCTAPMPALPCPRPGEVARIPGRLVFVGSDTLPNLDGLRWLLAEIWPKLLELYPAATLDLAGDCGSALPRLPVGVFRLGRVKDLSPVLHRAALAISPLRVGSGLKIKILDYARHGLVTVATAESLLGFAADAEAPFIPTGDAAGFALAVAGKLLANDPAEAASDEKRALRYVIRHYGVDSSFSGLAAALNLAGPAM